MRKRALLLGGFQETRSLAQSLHEMGYRITAVNADSGHCEALRRLGFAAVVRGDATRPEVLREADAWNADLAVALTAREADNLIACQLCKRLFHVRRTVALARDPEKTGFFYKLGVDSVVCAAQSVRGLIEQREFLSGVATLIPIGEGRLNVAEVPISQAAPIAGQKIWEIDLPPEVIIGCILRGEQSIVPRGDTRILAGDVLILIAADRQEMQAVRKLTGRPGRAGEPIQSDQS